MNHSTVSVVKTRLKILRATAPVERGRHEGDGERVPVGEQGCPCNDQRYEQLTGGEPAREVGRRALWVQVAPAVDDGHLQALHAREQEHQQEPDDCLDRRTGHTMDKFVDGVIDPEDGQDGPDDKEHDAHRGRKASPDLDLPCSLAISFLHRGWWRGFRPHLLRPRICLADEARR